MQYISETREDGEIRKLSLEEMREIYESHMRQDFPANERKPFSSIEGMWKRGVYQGYGLSVGGEWKAYWFLLYVSEHKLYLLDYLAVVRGCRGQGYGSKVLQAMKESVCREGNLILLEVEDPDCAEDAGQRRMRQERIAFYQKNGARLTKIRTRIYQTPYCLVLLGERSGQIREDDWIRTQYQRMYVDFILPENGHTLAQAGFLFVPENF